MTLREVVYSNQSEYQSSYGGGGRGERGLAKSSYDFIVVKTA